MGAPELMVLSLGLSVVVAVLGWTGGRGVERVSADPRLRDRIWAGALVLPALPPLAVGLMLLTPAPVREISLAATTLPAGLAPAPVGSAVVASQAFALDPTMAAWVVLGVAAVLTAVRLAALALRAGRLLRVIGQAEAPGPAVMAMVEAAARDLAIRPPRVGVSAATSEALLASLGPARLILPVGLSEAADAEAARAVIAHELAHLKRGDHRAVWMEEALLVALAFNPLMPVLRARRAAAREEACDALALQQAAPDIRRAYARSLIEALRDRAGPHASGGLPALTFTGAGRTTAMRRLKAVLNPAPAAGRGLRLTAFGLAGLIALLGGAGSLAVAAEREAVLVINAAAPVTGSEAAAERADGPGPAAASTLLAEQSRSVDLGPDTRTLLNGAPLPEGLPMWAVAAERVDVRTNERPRAVNLILAFTGTVPVSVDGHRMPDGFPVSGVSPEAVARVETIGGHVMYTLKPEAEVRRDRISASRERAAARMATDTARNALSPEQQARYRDPTAREYQTLCASADPGDDGFCAGVMFSQLQADGLCLPAELDRGSEIVRRAALGDLVARGKAEIARASIRPGDRPTDVARSALARAYPCDAAGATPVSQPGPLASGARAAPAEAAEVAGVETGGTGPQSQTPGTAVAPEEPRESEFLAERRAERAATREAWPSERGLRLPGWPRADRPARNSPFRNERVASDPQNARVPRP
ncbi:M56 family metallopeptidase [Brevundimonas sp. UBA2416]|mgnify:FL=1|uniref:M56 family metallopeptidase n=1 Tax=Brevundimonas sp. UBA2416 TaxID=1946124 RepID=UPI0025BA00D9|nr:M56 family metallopeptidase [Brevundimonas sp. UBA2416]